MKESLDIWKDILLRPISEENIICDIIEKRNVEKKNQYQLFEILICETLSKLYPDFHWFITPMSKDKGIDFWAIKNDRSLPFQTKNKPIVIYGQVKRAKNYFNKQKLIEATNKIVQAHNDSYLQERNVYKIMHLISSEKKIAIEFEITTGMVNTFQYIVEVINAEDIFAIWALNKKYFLSIMPLGMDKKEIQYLFAYLDKKSKKWADVIECRIESPDIIYLGDSSEYKLTITNHLNMPVPLEIHIHLSDTTISLIAPQNILKNSVHGLSITLYNKYSVNILIKITEIVNSIPAFISIHSTDGDEILRANFPLKNISSNFKTVINMKPILKEYKILCSAIADNREKLKFFSVVGEGGIGKSTLISEIVIWALNHNYSIFTIEHPCQETSADNVILELFEKLLDSTEYNISLYENLNDLLKIKLSNHYNPNWNNTMNSFFKERKIINVAQFFECIITLLIQLTDTYSVLLNFSNLHWSNAKLLDFFYKLIKNLQLNKSYFNNNLIILFEGRIFEAVKSDYCFKIAYEWFDFYNREPIISLKLEKWSDPLSKNYIESLFEKEGLDPIAQKNRLHITDLIYTHCKGNPMHIKEALIMLKTSKYIERIAYNSYIPVKINCCNIYIPNLIDTIKLRVSYYKKQWPFLIDMLIILSCFKNITYLYKFINTNNTEGNDWEKILIDSGFVNFENDQILFLHENYKNAFSCFLLTQDKNADNVLQWYCIHEYSLSLVEEIKIQLKKKEVNYLNIYQKIVHQLNISSDQKEHYELLLILLNIYEYLPSDKVMKRYHLYKQLETAAKEMGSWKTALEYNQKLKKLKLDNTDYMITCSHGRRNLANIYSFSMKWEQGIEEALNAISDLENFMKNNTFSFDEKFQLEWQRALLYNRLSIAYQFSGNHIEAIVQDKKAMQIAEKNKIFYAMYHIQYERGVWKLNTHPLAGVKLIEEAKNKLLEMKFVSQQEKDLVTIYYEMSLLKKFSTRKTFPKSILKEQLKRCIDLGKSESMLNEALEPIVCYTLCGILNIFLKNNIEAVNFFEKSLTIASRANMEQCLWMCYINVSQTYTILAQEDDIWKDTYNAKAKYYLQEAYELIAESLEINKHLENLTNVYSYPQKLFESANMSKTPKVIMSDKEISYSPVFIKYMDFAFFLL